MRAAHIWLSTADYELVKASPGDSAGQAKFEALTLLISVTTWLPLLATMQGSLTFVGDALGILQHALKLRAKEPVLNGIMVGEKFDLRRTKSLAAGSTSCSAVAP